jgi:Concanavalin A-like lectin/glucanases superfamily
MSVNSGPSASNSGLVLKIDAVNKKSNFLNTKNLIDFTTWTAGTNTLPWPANGDGAQNTLLYDTDPWGNSSLVLKTTPNNNYANGGWEGCAPGYWVSIDRTKKYRSCVWVRRTSSNTNGTFYHGLHTDGTSDVIQSDGTSQTNPYWACQGIGYLTQNQWYLHVGHIFPYNSTPTVDPNSGYWTRSGGWISNPGCNITGYDPRFPSDASLLRNRVYQYYASSDANSNLEFLYPRIDLCDGTEPSISDILSYNPAVSYDLSGYKNNGTRTNGLTYDGSGYVFNGSNYATVGAISGSFSSFTVSVWFNSTSVSNYRNPIDCNYSSYPGVTGNVGPRLEQNSSGNLVWVVSGSTTNNSVADNFTVQSSGLSANTWYNAVITWTSGSANTYLNGVPVTVNASTPNGFTGTFNSIVVGKGFSLGGTERSFIGSIGAVQIYNRVLSANEVLQNFTALRGRYGI